MNFFSSIFADDSEPESPPSNPVPDSTESDTSSPENPKPSSTPTAPEPPNQSPWAFKTLVKTLATQSESVIGTYRRDLEEFRSGLLKETAIVRDVASRAVKELPDSIDAGAAAAQESLQSVGQVIDNLGSSVWQGTSKIIARGKDLHLFDDDGGDGDGGGAGYSDDGRDGYLGDRMLSVKKYSWFDSRLREIQCDSRTYAEDPDDDDDYGKWREGFVMEENGEEIMRLVGEEKEVERLYLELVPVTVDKESFWSRYFYKVDKLKQAEEARSRIVKRAISGQDEEDLSWDVDDDNDDGSGDTITEDLGNQIHSVSGSAENKSIVKTSQEETPGLESNDKVLESNDKEVVQSSSGNFDEEKTALSMDNARTSSASDTSSVVKVDEVKVSDEKGDNCNSCKDSDVSVVSTQPSLAGLEDLGWDEIEDVGSDNDDNNKAAAASSSSTISDFRKRLSAAEDDDEDLTWDIEDDDEPIKS